MNSNNSNALVPLKNGNLPAVVKKKQELPVLSLVKEELYLENRHAVREQLPDILGRVLARIWIDEKFHHDLKYVERVNFFLDMRIFLKSFFIIFNQKIINQDKDLTMKRFDDQ